MTEKAAIFNSAETKGAAHEQPSLYSKMYVLPCAAASAAVDALPYSADTLQARCLLEKALQEAEEIYLCHAE